MPDLMDTLHRMKPVAPVTVTGRVEALRGLVIRCTGLGGFLKAGDRCMIEKRSYEKNKAYCKV